MKREAQYTYLIFHVRSVVKTIPIQWCGGTGRGERKTTTQIKLRRTKFETAPGPPARFKRKRVVGVAELQYLLRRSKCSKQTLYKSVSACDL